MQLEINLKKQLLTVFDQQQKIIKTYLVSTAKNGAGEQINSEKTPRGRHEIFQKIGAGVPINSVFVGRKLTGEIYAPDLKQQFPNRDWILTRILWLSGLEPGKNQGGEIDTKARYIYLHGTPEATPVGEIGSRGCIRMRNQAIIELFDWVSVGDIVNIIEG